MAVTFFWRCESEALDATHDYSAGDTTATANGAVGISATGAKVGSNGIVTTNAADYYLLDSASIVTIDQGCFGFWIQWKTAMPGIGLVTGMSILDSATGFQAIQVQVATVPEDELRLQIKSGANISYLPTSAAGLSINNWYFVKCAWHLSQDKRLIAVYDSTLTLVEPATEDTSTDLSTFIPTSVDTIRIGNPSSDVNPIWMDVVMFGSSYTDPLQDYATYSSYTQFTPTPWQQLYRRPNTLLRM